MRGGGRDKETSTDLHEKVLKATSTADAFFSRREENLANEILLPTNTLGWGQERDKSETKTTRNHNNTRHGKTMPFQIRVLPPSRVHY
jgi:hypothetical protein